MNRPTVEYDPARPLIVMLAGAAALLLVFKLPGTILFPAVALVIGLAMAPIVLSRLAAFRAGRVLSLVLLVALLSGLLLRATTEPTIGAPGAWTTVITLAAWLVSIPFGVGLGWWAKDHLLPDTFMRLLLVGAVASALLIEQPFTWKGNTGVYVTLLALALVPSDNRWATRVILVGSAVLSAVSDARFMSVIAIVVLVSTLVGDRLRRSISTHPFASVIVVVVGLSVLVQSALAAMRSGLLGAEIAARTIAQTAGGRNIIEGGRTEWAASLHLFSVQPWGLGLAEVVNGGVAREAIAHVQSVGGDYTSSYFIINVFGQRTDLHSILADLWYHFGVGGVLFALVALVVLVRALPSALALPVRPAALALFAMATGAWDLLFSPMPESDRLTLALLVAVLCADGYFSRSSGETSEVRAESGLSLRRR